MARKGKKKRESRRQIRQDAGGVARPGSSLDDSAESETPPVDQIVPSKQPRQKRKKKGGTRVRVSPWWLAGAAAVAAVGVFAFLIATSGSSGVSAPRATAPPDPRLGGAAPVQTLQLEAGGSDVDAYFNPTQLTGPAGDVIEFEITNTGTLSHNLTVAGLDGEYDTADDWVSDPELILPGEQGRLALKIDEPGTYAFQCSLHPQAQFGNLVLQ